MLPRPLFRTPHIAIARIAAALALPMLLVSCVLAPGKFTSTLKIDTDGSFAFTYVGEVIDAEPEGADVSDGLSADDSKPSAAQKAKAKAEAAAKTETKRRAIAAALTKEAGFRKVTYLGDGKFMVDYAVTGKLTHTFVWPFNLDAEVLFPFIAIERRQGGAVRVKAPAFANDDSGAKQMGGMPGGGPGAASQLDGTFTLDTDAAIVSQNNEEGATTTGARKVIVWRATPLSKSAPTAVLKLASPD